MSEATRTQALLPIRREILTTHSTHLALAACFAIKPKAMTAPFPDFLFFPLHGGHLITFCALNWLAVTYLSWSHDHDVV